MRFSIFFLFLSDDKKNVLLEKTLLINNHYTVNSSKIKVLYFKYKSNY